MKTINGFPVKGYSAISLDWMRRNPSRPGVKLVHFGTLDRFEAPTKAQLIQKLADARIDSATMDIAPYS